MSLLWSRDLVLRYGSGAAAAGVTTLANFALQDLMEGRAPFLPYFPMLIGVALCCDVGPAVLALLLAVVAAGYFWLPGLGTAQSADLYALVLFAMAGAAVVAVAARALGATRRLADAQGRLDAAHVSTGMVEWEWDLASDSVRLSSSARAVFGTRWTKARDALAIAHPEERERVEALIRSGLESSGYQFVSRMCRPDDGRTRWVETRAVVHRDASGRPTQVTGISLDVTDKHLALAAAKDAEHRFRVALKGASIIAWACDAQRRYTWVYNPAAGFSPGDFIGRPVGSLAPDDRGEYLEAIERVWVTGRAERVPITWEHRGQTRHYVSSVDPVFDAAGAVVGLVGASIDVTALQRARQETATARQELQAIVDVMASGVYRADRQRRYVWANRRYLDWVGLEHDALIGRPVAEVADPATWAVKRPHVEQVLSGALSEFEQPMRSPGGESRWMHASYRPTRDAGGAVDGWVAVLTDLTDRHRIEAALRESEERLRLALHGAEIGMWSTDLATGRTECTPRNLQIFGLPTDQRCDERATWQNLIEPADLDLVLDAWQRAVDGGLAYEAEYRIRRASDRVQRWVLTRGQVHRDANGAPLRLVGITMDISERKLAEAALADANRRKDEFLATLAHELRNPLAPIRYVTRVLRADTPPEMIEDAGRMIERQLAHMARLLDDLLDVSRITRGALELRRAPLDMRGVVESAVADIRPLAERVEHALQVDLPDTALIVDGDSTRLVQVLSNLLNNAVRYTDPGGTITVTARVEGAEVVTRIRDTGIGIAPEMQTRIFELFTQGERSLRGSMGLGIGLALSRQLAEMHGGRLEARSAGRDEGSEFTLHLPWIAEQPALDGAAGAVPLNVAVLGAAQTPVLIVDDNKDAADSLAQVLRLAGYSPKVAYDGATALEMAEILRPSLVLLDLGLPGLSGHDVARRMRTFPWAAQARIIAVTGWGQEEHRARSRESGFDAHLTKPVDPEVLLGWLASASRGAA